MRVDKYDIVCTATGGPVYGSSISRVGPPTRGCVFRFRNYESTPDPMGFIEVQMYQSRMTRSWCGCGGTATRFWWFVRCRADHHTPNANSDGVLSVCSDSKRATSKPCSMLRLSWLCNVAGGRLRLNGCLKLRQLALGCEASHDMALDRESGRSEGSQRQGHAILKCICSPRWGVWYPVIRCSAPNSVCLQPQEV